MLTTMEYRLRVGSFGVALTCAALCLPGCNSTSSAKSLTAVRSASVQARRDVKTAIDPDASKIDKAATDTTIEDIVAQKLPKGRSLGGRVGPFETTTWRVRATLESVQLMKDGDYYLVMKGNKGGETVVEVPDPKECNKSPLLPQISAARQQIEERYHPTSTAKNIHEEATVTGVGFLGWPNNKGGKGRTGPRLMPGVGFEFDKKG